MSLRRNLFAFVILLPLTVVPSLAQRAEKTSAKTPTTQTQSAPAQEPQKKDATKSASEAFIKASNDYKESLEALLKGYERTLKAQDEKYQKLQQLYQEGLIARRELEAEQGASAELRAKVEETRKQIAATDLAIAEAKRQPEVVAAAVETANAFAAGRGAVNWTTGNRAIDNLIRANAARFGVDPYLVYCVMHQESGFNSRAVSNKGAQGLMQLMPGTAARFGVTNPNDPSQSIRAGTQYLSQLLGMFSGRVELALAAYNAGEGAVMKYGNRIPPYKETQNYVRLIGGQYSRSATPTVTPAKKKKKKR